MSKIVARLGAVLGFESKDFVKGVNEAQQKSKDFKKSLRETQQAAETLKTGLAVAGAALVGFGVNALSVADDISDLADANDTTVGSIIELQHALEMSGGKADNAKVMLSAFTNAIDGAAQGSDKLRDSFKAAGVSIHDLATMSGDELRNKVLDGLAGIDDAVRRNAIAMDLFGKSAKGVDFSEMSANADQLRGKYDAQAKAVQDAAAAFQKIKIIISDMQLAAMQAMQPLSNFINELPTEGKVDAISKAFTILGDVIFATFAVRAVAGIVAFGAAAKNIIAANPLLMAVMLSKTAYDTSVAIGGEKKSPTEKWFEENIPNAGLPITKNEAIANIGSQTFLQTDLSSDTTGGIKRQIVVTDAQKKAIEDAKKLEQDFLQVLDDAVDRQRKFNSEIFNLKVFQIDRNNQIIAEYNDSADLLDLEARRYKLTEAEYAKSKLALDQKIELRKISAEAMREEAAAMTELGRASAEDYPRARAVFDQKILNIQKTAEMQKIVAVELGIMETQQLDESIARQQSWAEGWEEAMRRYEEASTKASDRGRAAFEMVVSSMNTALAKFVETGKLNIKDLFGTMIKQMILAEMQAKASGIFSMIVKSAFNAWTGGASSAATGSAASISGDLFGGLTGHASGGYVDSPSIVGENGAELFIPRTPGTIIPNGAWQSQVSNKNEGMTINGNYIANMSAIDTQSGMQFLAKNKDTIWAAYQSANRSVPISR